MAQYRLLHTLGLIDARKCNTDFGASLDLTIDALKQDCVIELPEKAAAYLTGPRPKGRGYVSLLQPANVKGEAKRPEVTAPAK